MAGEIRDWEVPHAAAQGQYGSPVDPRMLLQQLYQLVASGQPLDMSLAQQPGRMPVQNPFGMGPDYDAAPALNPPRSPNSLSNYQPPLDELWSPINPMTFSTQPPEASALLDWLGQLIPRGVDNR